MVSPRSFARELGPPKDTLPPTPLVVVEEQVARSGGKLVQATVEADEPALLVAAVGRRIGIRLLVDGGPPPDLALHGLLEETR